MKRGEKPEGYRQMRPKTFPASNYTGNSRQMLQEIRESLRNLSRPSDSAKTEQGSGKGVTEDPRQQGRNSNPKFVTYHKALQEIRNSLLPFANEPSSSGRGGSEVNRQMLQDLQAAGFEEEMVIRALKQTNCRSLEAAIEYISKMSYQDPWREQMVAAAVRPVNAGMKAPGSGHVQQPINRKQSWKGSKESLVQRHGPPLVEGVMYRSDSPGSPSEMGVRPLSGSGLTAFSQVHQGNGQRVNPPPPPQVRSITPPPPPPRGTTPPPTSWDTNPSTKRFSGNMEFLVPRVSPGPQGAWSEGYSAHPPPGQRGISSVPLGRQPIIMQSSGGTKFSFPPGWSQNGTGPPDFLGPPPPYPMSQGNRQSPPASQMQAGGPVSSPTYANGSNLPQSMMVSNRNSHNLDLYNIASIPSSWPQPLPPSQPQSSPCNSGHATSWQHKLPVRSNSFTNPQLSGRPIHPASSQPSATTVTAITQAPILQPVKSMRVQKPELQTAVAPTHPPWMQQPPPPSGSPPSLGSSPVVAEVPSYQGPPPPYPKHLLQQPNQSYDSSAKSGSSKEDQVGVAGRKEQEEESSSGSINERAEVTEGAIGVSAGSADKEKKQISTSPVPVRRNKKDESRIQIYSPQAFKFFMEQHVENILKNHQQRLRRKKQLESEMQRSS
ncbi:serine/threonine-protein kinase LATS1 isoform X2 [Polyodon spathula]|uniref:serine/threonine-protein kinase LATS1 isoform X2 n=1 Tax=Polyodon spathula TaxID=7913 RepID=UPI001B7E4B54|nr:serine/threonine-protein kinase LATS1 isoform X2 [Polyodon spathula]